jgi:hypothetical protein
METKTLDGLLPDDFKEGLRNRLNRLSHNFERSKRSLTYKRDLPLIGFRAWYWNWSPKGGKLESISSYGTSWPYGKILRAEHTKETEHFDCNCTCGIYSLYSLEELHKLLVREYAELLVSGAVECWGKIEMHEIGMRAEYARPIAILKIDELFRKINKRETQKLGWTNEFEKAYLDLIQGEAYQAANTYSLPLLSWEALKIYVGERGNLVQRKDV